MQMFTRTDANWKIKLVLSSYSFINNAHGYPDGKSDCSKLENNANIIVVDLFLIKKLWPNSRGCDAGSNVTGKKILILEHIEILMLLMLWDKDGIIYFNFTTNIR